jgi:hypothetical protein
MNHGDRPLSGPLEARIETAIERYPDPRPAERPGASRELVIFVSVVMSFLFATLLVIVYLVQPGRDAGPRSLLPPARLCKEGDASGCPANHTCYGGECVPDTTPICAADAACGPDKCECPKGTYCAEGKCVQTTDAFCSSPEVRKLVSEIVGHCNTPANKDVPPMGCTAEEWRALAIRDGLFDQLVASFPTAISLHFPEALPPIDGVGQWPNAAGKQHYRAHLERFASTLLSAKVIFIVGRASASGPPEINNLYGRRRMAAAESWVRELYAGRSNAEKDALDGKIKSFTLGHHHQLSITFFQTHLADRMTAWDTDSTRRLLMNVAAGSRIESGERLWTVSTLNQSTLVVPVPCDGSEVKP